MNTTHRQTHPRLAALLAVALLAGALSPAQADDIDIYAGSPGANGTPNVLIMLDNSANWSASNGTGSCYYNSNGVPTSSGPPAKEQGTKMGTEKCALYNVIDALPVASSGAALFNVGFMLFNDTTSTPGGFPLKALTPLTAANKAALESAIAKLNILSDKASNAPFSLGLYESYLYLTAKKPWAGTAGTNWDRAATDDGNAAGPYVLPPGGGSCTRSYVIFLANGSPQNTGPEKASGTQLAAVGGNTTEIPYANSYITTSDQADLMDEWARFLLTTNIVTHGIAVTGAPSDGLYPNFVKSVAVAGGGNYYAAKDSATLTTDLLKIFADIQSVSSIFASASLPVAVNARGTYLNQVFMGMFLPDQNAAPRWNGNLKQYAFAFDPATNTLSLVDQNGTAAISSSTGFIAPTASAFWTTASSFWVNAPAGTPPSASDAPDGAIVAKGAAAESLRTTFATDQSTRRVYTCLPCSAGTALGGSPATLFATTNAGITQAALGATTPAEVPLIINWVRGTDDKVPSDELGPGAPTTVRPSIHGDVLHSQPAVVNYGGSTGVVVFYGANDGMLHAVNGNQAGPGAGSELWGFVPPEGLGKLKRLRDNSPLVAFPNVSPLLNPAPRGYFFDGPVSFYQHVNASGATDKVILYAAMRRGGQVLYAFDVTIPTQPVFLWKASAATIPNLGQTWSEARVAKIRGNPNPVLVMGGGYDAAAEDADPAAASTTLGTMVVVLDAFSGAVLRTFPTARSVPAAVSLIDSNGDGYIDRGYTVDLGGNIYRLDLEVGTNTSSGAWTLTTLASLGSSGGKKLFYAPDVVLTKNFAVVLVGSGDREKPLKTTSSDYFYTVIDKNPGLGMPPGFSPITFADLTSQASFGQSSTLGCYLPMDTAGEKVINAATTVGGITYFGTNEPNPVSSSSCTANLGIAKAYAVPLLCGAPTRTVLNGGGLMPSPVSGVVQVSYTDATGAVVTAKEPFIIGGGALYSPISASKIVLSTPPRRSRRYWIDESTP